MKVILSKNTGIERDVSSPLSEPPDDNQSKRGSNVEGEQDVNDISIQNEIAYIEVGVQTASADLDSGTGKCKPCIADVTIGIHIIEHRQWPYFQAHDSIC